MLVCQKYEGQTADSKMCLLWMDSNGEGSPRCLPLGENPVWSIVRLLLSLEFSIMITEGNISQYKPTGKYSRIESTGSAEKIGDCRIVEACTHGMECLMLLERRVPDRSDDYESTGNLLLDDILQFRCMRYTQEGG